MASGKGIPRSGGGREPPGTERVGVGVDRRGRRLVLGGLAGERVPEAWERGGGGDGC